MAFVIHPKYRPWRDVLQRDIRSSLEKAFRALYGLELATELSAHKQKKLEEWEKRAALLAMQGFIHVTAEYRRNELKKAERRERAR